MSRSSNPLFTFEWMFPLLKEQLLTLHQQLQSWQQQASESGGEHADSAEQLAAIAEQYQQVFAKLEMMDLADFASLTQQLVRTLQAIATYHLPVSSADFVFNASEQLLQQLTHHVELGSYQRQPLLDSLQLLQSLLIEDEPTDSPALTVLQPYIEQLVIPADAEDCDPEIKEIFLEEAEEVLQEIKANLKRLPHLSSDKQALTTIRRGFHTLKGSGRMAGALCSAELAWAIENMLNRVLEGSIDEASGMHALVEDVVSAYPNLMHSFDQHSAYPQQLSIWMAAANVYAKNQQANFDYTQLLQAAEQPPIEKEPEPDQSLAVDSMPAVEEGVLTNLANANARLQQEANQEQAEVAQPDTALQQVFVDEATELLETIKQWLDKVQSQSASVVEGDVIRAFHTLRGAANSQGLSAIGEISATVEQSLDLLQQQQQPLSTQHIQMIAQSVTLICQYIQIQQQHPDQQLQQDVHQLQHDFDHSVTTEAGMTAHDKDIHLSVADLIEGIDTLLDAEWQLPKQIQQSDSAESVIDYFEQLLAQSQLLFAKVTESETFVRLLNALQQVYQAVIEHPQLFICQQASQSSLANQAAGISGSEAESETVEQAIGILTLGHEQLLGLFDSLAGSMALKVDADIIERLQQIAYQISQLPIPVSITEASLEPVVEKTAATDTVVVNESAAVSDSPQHDNLQLELADIDPELLAIFVEEAQTIDEDSSRQFELWQQDPQSQEVIQVMQRHLHTLKGGARMAGIDSIAELSHEAENLYEYFANQQIAVTPAWVSLMQSVQDIVSTQIEMLAKQGQSFYVPHIIEQLQQLAQHKQLAPGYQLPPMIPPVAEPHAQPSNDVSMEVDNRSTDQQQAEEWVAQPVSQLADTGQVQPAMPVAPLANEQQDSPFADQDSQSLASVVAEPAVAEPVVPIAVSDNETQSAESVISRSIAETDISSIELEFDRMKSESWEGHSPDPDILSIFLEEANDIIDTLPELKQQLQQLISDESADQDQSSEQRQVLFAELQRALHLLKGGAHMVHADATVDVADALQAVYKKLEQYKTSLPVLTVELLSLAHTWLVQAVYLLGQGINPPKAQALVSQLQRVSKQPDNIQELPDVSLQDYVQAVARYENWRDARLGLRDISQMPPDLNQDEQEEESGHSSSEMIRVPTCLMEQMINLSGESAINRSRIELSMSSVSSTLSEMGSTVKRLAEQLRRMDIELEAQIRSQLDDSYLQADAGFDPLEMDQYSVLNQLSKSLAESASDLLDIKTTLYNKTQDTETLLLQLAQTQTQLQQGLMTSRMVPFSRLLPRLQRTVRQTASELGKSVQLTVINEQDEIDRTILERISSPLEHMLRNAVDHGIESPDKRQEYGKSQEGRIVIDISREGSEIVIRLQDDGQGIDVASVRRKAVSRGLIAADDQHLTDLEVMQYIFHAGLSTASNLTQISGRGVGMDVVLSEVRKLGGSVSAQSQTGKGTEFVLRLPLTIAVADALIVRAGDQTFAIPLLQIERIERVPLQRLSAFYYADINNVDAKGSDTQIKNSGFQIADSHYRLRYLTQMLLNTAPEYHSADNSYGISSSQSAPVILLKTQAGQPYALHVDEIVGPRVELVVKPLGRPLSSITGLSAATITADGSVMLILDVLALMRNAPNTLPPQMLAEKRADARLTAAAQHQNLADQSLAAQRLTTQAASSPSSSNAATGLQTPAQPQLATPLAARSKGVTPKILIVDDSVTVRKVTSRMLARQGYETHVARDGVEAVAMLQTLQPDLMLLDIEMPRMDGFEVAAHVRHDPRLQGLPIIMITSRTGDKHRQRAAQLGVNEYMGKPFQEATLISSIQSLLSQQAGVVSD